MNVFEIKNLPTRLNEVGRIKIGKKGSFTTSRAGNKFQPPTKINHFLVTTNDRGADGNYIVDKSIMDKLGNDPKEIPVMLLYDDKSLNFQTRYAIYNGTKCILEGDGETWRRLQADGSWKECAEPTEQLDPAYKKTDKCKMNGTLSVIIRNAEVVGGVWKFRTTGFNSITAINSSLSLISKLTGGYLAGIPLSLIIAPKTGINPQNGETCQFNVVNIVFKGAPELLRERGLDILKAGALYHQQTQLIEQQVKMELSKRPSSFDEEPLEIIEEFYPDNVETDNSGEEEDALAKLAHGVKVKVDGKEIQPTIVNNMVDANKMAELGKRVDSLAKAHGVPDDGEPVAVEEPTEETETTTPPEEKKPEKPEKVVKPRQSRKKKDKVIESTTEESKVPESPENDVLQEVEHPSSGVVEEESPKTSLPAKEHVKVMLIEEGLNSDDLRHAFYKKYPMEPEEYVANCNIFRTNVDNFKKRLILSLQTNIPSMIDQLSIDDKRKEAMRKIYQDTDQNDFTAMISFYADLKRSV